MKILNKSVAQLEQLFADLRELQHARLLERAKALSDGQEAAQQPSRREREILTNKLPLVKSLMYMAQENLLSLLADKLFEQRLDQTIAIARTVKDAPCQITTASEADIQGKIKCIEEYYGRIKELFGDPAPPEGEQGDAPLDASEEARETLESLVLSQIQLMKVYNDTPVDFVGKKEDIHYPIATSLKLLQYTLLISDLLAAEEASRGKAGPGLAPDQQPGKPCSLRRAFLQNDGLKHAFGVRIVERHCEDVEAFMRKEISYQLDGPRPLPAGIEEFVGALANSRASMVKVFEDQIKALLFVQFRQNYKTETQQDLAELFKPFAGAIGSKQGAGLAAGAA